ncbi:MAG: hypothetical protein Q4C95_04975 [Planctomycetia bacterium]|nr:hypothetical protein [Planctomycetia bacterium]
MKQFLHSIDSLRRYFFIRLIFVEFCRFFSFFGFCSSGIILLYSFAPLFENCLANFCLYLTHLKSLDFGTPISLTTDGSLSAKPVSCNDFVITSNYLLLGYLILLFSYVILLLLRISKKSFNRKDIIKLLSKSVPSQEGMLVGALDFSSKLRKANQLTSLECQTILLANEWLNSQEKRKLGHCITKSLNGRKRIRQLIFALTLFVICSLFFPKETRLFWNDFQNISNYSSRLSDSCSSNNKKIENDESGLLNDFHNIPTNTKSQMIDAFSSINPLNDVQISENDIFVLLNHFCEQLSCICQLKQTQLERLSFVENNFSSQKMQILIDGQNEIAHLWEQPNNGLETISTRMIQNMNHSKFINDFYFILLNSQIKNFLQFRENDRLFSQEMNNLLGGLYRQNQSSFSKMELQKNKSLFESELNLLTEFAEQFDLLRQIGQLKNQRTLLINQQTDILKRLFKLLKSHSGQNVLTLSKKALDENKSLRNSIKELISNYNDWSNGLLTFDHCAFNAFLSEEVHKLGVPTFQTESVSATFSDIMNESIENLNETIALISQNWLGKAIQKQQTQINLMQSLSTQHFSDLDPLLSLLILVDSSKAKDLISENSTLSKHSASNFNDPIANQTLLLNQDDLVQSLNRDHPNQSQSPAESQTSTQSPVKTKNTNVGIPNESVQNRGQSHSDLLLSEKNKHLNNSYLQQNSDASVSPNDSDSGTQPSEAGNVLSSFEKQTSSFSSEFKNSVPFENWGELPKWDQKSDRNNRFSQPMPTYEATIQQYFRRLEQMPTRKSFIEADRNDKVDLH